MGSRYGWNHLRAVALNRPDTVVQGAMAAIFSLLGDFGWRNARLGSVDSAHAQRNENPGSRHHQAGGKWVGQMAGNNPAAPDRRDVLFSMANSTAKTGMYDSRTDSVFLRWNLPVHEPGQNGALLAIV